MDKTESKKTWDAVEAVRELRDAHYERTKDMTEEERLLFYRQEGRKAQDSLERLARSSAANKKQE